MKNIDELKRKSISGVVSYGVRTFLLYLVAVGATALLGIYLDPDEFGVYFVVVSVIGLFTFLSDVGLAAALVQKKTEPNLEELRTTFTVQQILAVGIFLLTLLLTPVWREVSGLNQDGLELLYALGFSFLLASLKTIPSILMERQLLFNRLVIPQIVEQILFYGIAVILAREGLGVRSFTYAVLARSIAGVIVIYMLQTWPIGLSISRKALKGLLNFGVKFQANDLLARLKDDLYIVVLAKFLGPTQMGYIGWAKRWSMFPYQFSVNNVVAITFPTYSRLQEQKQFLQRAIEKSLFFITLLIFPVLVGMSVLAYPLTLMIPEYAKWQPALPALYFFAINISWAAVSSPLTNLLNAIGEIDKTLKLMIMWTGLTWLLTPPAVNWFGGTGVAMVSAVVGTTSVATIWLAKKELDFRFLHHIWRQLVASLAMGLVLMIDQGLWGTSAWHFLGAVALGGGVYLLVMALIGYNMLKREILSVLKNKS